MKQKHFRCTAAVGVFLLAAVLCSLCILAVVAATTDGTATAGTATDKTATNGAATNGIATDGASANETATGGIATEGAISEKPENLSAPVTPGFSLTFYVKNNLEMTPEQMQRTPEYLAGRLDYLDKENAAYSSLPVTEVAVETVEECKTEALGRAAAAGYSSCSIYSVDEKYLLATNNYDQTYLSSGFEITYKTDAPGTCSEVAGTSVAEYYYRKGYGGTLGHSDRQTIFNRLLLEATECGAYPAHPKNGGTYSSKFKNAMTGYYDYYNVDLKGNYDTLLLKSKIENSLSSYKPLIGNFSTSASSHAMCICGYYDITVRYKKTSGASSYSYITYRYYRVNDGQKSGFVQYENQTNDRLQYIYEGYLTSITRIV